MVVKKHLWSTKRNYTRINLLSSLAKTLRIGKRAQNFSNVPFLKYWHERKTFSFMTFPIERWSYKMKMDDMQQLLDSEGPLPYISL